MSDVIQGFQLSENQIAIWKKLSAHGMIGGAAAILRVRTKLDKEDLRRSVLNVVARHESLRTFYKKLPAMTIPIQQIVPDFDRFEIFGQEFNAVEKELRTRPWEEHDLPFRVYSCDLSNQVVLHLHPMSGDLQSLANLIEEVNIGLSSDQDVLAQDVVQYVDVVQWELEQKDAVQNTLPPQAAGPLLDLKLPFARDINQGLDWTHNLIGTLNQNELTILSNQEGIKTSTYYLASVLLLLSRYGYNGESKVPLDFIFHNREFSEFQKTVGPFAKKYLAAFHVDEALTFGRLCQSVSEQFEKLLSSPQEHCWRTDAVSQVGFQFVETSGHGGETVLSLDSLFEIHPENPLNFTVLIGKEEFKIWACYNASAFLPSGAKDFLGNLQGMVADNWKRLGEMGSEINVLAETQFHHLIRDFNKTEFPVAGPVLIHQLFEAQAAQSPDKIAVYCGEETISYGELNLRASKIASFILNQNSPNHYVGVFLNKSADIIAAVLGVLKAGKAYLPLEPSLPVNRISWLIENQALPILITHTDLFEGLRESVKVDAVLFMDEEKPLLKDSNARQEGKGESTSDQKDWNSAAYTIFTSGTTGTPKGVMVSHKPVINTINWVNRKLEIGTEDCLLFITSLSFDLSVYDIFGVLAAGASIYVATSEELKSPEKLIEILDKGIVTLWDSAPAALMQLVPFFDRVKPSLRSKLRWVMLSGDWIPLSLPGQITKRFPTAKVMSLGGATEATIWSNYYPVSEVDFSRPSIPYGRPIDNAKYYVLNSSLQPCPVGVAGELYIGGDCLADGYFKDSDLTKSKFLSNPFLDERTARIYRTGDLAKHGYDGEIELLGRVDNQVKIRGYRIELGEIDATLRRYPGVSECVSLVKTEESMEKSLVSFYIADKEHSLDDLKKFLTVHLPSYMVPDFYVRVETFPMNLNGKLDRDGLLEFEKTVRASLTDYVKPRNSVEELYETIWKKVLKIEKASVTATFTSLGGNSIAAMVIVAEADRLGLNISPQIFMVNDTIEKLARLSLPENG